MTKTIRRICILACCLALLLSGVFGAEAAVPDDYTPWFSSLPESSHPLSTSKDAETFYEYILQWQWGMDVVRWPAEKKIPMHYGVYVHDPQEIWEGTLYCESTLDIAHTLDAKRVYKTVPDGEFWLRFELELLELPQKQTVDFKSGDIPQFDKISILTFWDGKEIEVESFYLLNCQYGLFLCKYDGWPAYKAFAEWEETFQAQLRVWIVTAAVLIVYIIVMITGIVMWNVRRRRIKKRISSIQTVSLQESGTLQEQP